MIKLYKSCSTLPIHNFFELFETEDMRNLIHGFDFDNDKLELTDEEKWEYKAIFDKIFFEYCELTSNHGVIQTLKKEVMIEQWSFVFTTATKIISIYQEYNDKDILECLGNLESKYKVDLSKDINPQLKKVELDLKHLKNKIKLFKIKLADKAKNKKSDVKIDLEKDALYLERNLELNRSIDTKTTSVKKWVSLLKIQKEKTTSNGKN